MFWMGRGLRMADSRREGGERSALITRLQTRRFIFMAYSLASELHCRCVASQTLSVSLCV
ncbi:Uncharacterized protein APZ42_033236 [Daphnia magna]|uniref:Uncharacterized protein n=1 Tax=Daphnia magna TaxID=35525 RepID=A0A164L8Z4_9CRUS|nr:Uncharacterized protein APZ42_033236 [Daphnia magna]